MATPSKISKMFGALVLGGCMHQGTPANADSAPTPTDASTATPAKTSAPAEADAVADSEAGPKPDSVAQPNQDPCQLEFTLNKYTRFNAPGAEPRNKVERSTTCLDEKTDAEILKIINEAKGQTCKTPFCGCWLG